MRQNERKVIVEVRERAASLQLGKHLNSHLSGSDCADLGADGQKKRAGTVRSTGLTCDWLVPWFWNSVKRLQILAVASS